MILSKLPPGMRYYIGAEARLRRAVEDMAMSVFEGWSYEEVLTPTVDYYALFEQGMGMAEAQSSFRFTDNDGRMLSLRPDITSSVARMAATLLADRERPLRLCYAAPVFRQQQQSHAEWRRENTQLGCELIGGGNAGDIEVLLLAAEVLQRIGLKDEFCITINDVGILNGMLSDIALESSAREIVRNLIDSRDTTELEKFLSHQRIPNQLSESLLRLTQLTGKKEVLHTARTLITNRDALTSAKRLAEVWEVVDFLGMSDSFEVDLADVSSLDYYTGLSFKVFVKGVGYRVGRGGRYDGLTANFGTAEPAVGFVLNLDSLIEVLGRSPFGNGTTRESVQVINGTDLKKTFSEAIKRRSRNEQVRIGLEI